MCLVGSLSPAAHVVRICLLNFYYNPWLFPFISAFFSSALTILINSAVIFGFTLTIRVDWHHGQRIVNLAAEVNIPLFKTGFLHSGQFVIL